MLMLDQLGEILGTVGSARIAKEYNFSESDINMIKRSYHPGHLLMWTLLSKEKDLRCKESLQKLQMYLQETGLFRASYIIRDFVRKVRDFIYSVLLYN